MQASTSEHDIRGGKVYGSVCTMSGCMSVKADTLVQLHNVQGFSLSHLLLWCCGAARGPSSRSWSAIAVAVLCAVALFHSALLAVCGADGVSRI
jgi:hypothetical protein